MQETNYIDSSTKNEDERINTNPVSGSSCVYPDCEDNEDEVHIAETVAIDDVSLDEWMHYDESFATINNNPATPVSVKEKDVAPISVLICQTIQRHHSMKPLVYLFNGRSSCSLLNIRNISIRLTPTLTNRQLTITSSGTFNMSRTVHLNDIKLP